ncbi:MAG: rhodanese-like domain-containing protein [Methylacidiphilales bacterium]|nr:rhodanese-like domain-containing protein [Candidatus Methylacidiphilales bacterium]MDW8349319.1 rhodanese-like domain-containing protein [Verrucomicrobiae bacterium]
MLDQDKIKQKVIFPALVLMGVAVVPACLTAWLHPKRPPFSADSLREGEIAIAEAWKIREEVLWVDARSQGEYEQAHIPGAVLLNEDQWNDRVQDVLMRWRPERRTIVYCSTTGCQASHHVAERLRKMGLTDVWVLKGGWERWQKYMSEQKP